MIVGAYSDFNGIGSVVVNFVTSYEVVRALMTYISYTPLPEISSGRTIPSAPPGPSGAGADARRAVAFPFPFPLSIQVRAMARHWL